MRLLPVLILALFLAPRVSTACEPPEGSDFEFPLAFASYEDKNLAEGDWVGLNGAFASLLPGCSDVFVFSDYTGDLFAYYPFDEDDSTRPRQISIFGGIVKKLDGSNPIDVRRLEVLD